MPNGHEDERLTRLRQLVQQEAQDPRLARLAELTRTPEPLTEEKLAEIEAAQPTGRTALDVLEQPVAQGAPLPEELPPPPEPTAFDRLIDEKLADAAEAVERAAETPQQKALRETLGPFAQIPAGLAAVATQVARAGTGLAALAGGPTTIAQAPGLIRAAEEKVIAPTERFLEEEFFPEPRTGLESVTRALSEDIPAFVAAEAAIPRALLKRGGQAALRRVLPRLPEGAAAAVRRLAPRATRGAAVGGVFPFATGEAAQDPLAPLKMAALFGAFDVGFGVPRARRAVRGVRRAKAATAAREAEKAASKATRVADVRIHEVAGRRVEPKKPKRELPAAAKLGDEELQAKRLREMGNLARVRAGFEKVRGERLKFEEQAGGARVIGATTTQAGRFLKGRQTQTERRLLALEAEAKLRGLPKIEPREVDIEAGAKGLKGEDFDVRKAKIDRLVEKREELTQRLADNPGDVDAGTMWGAVEQRISQLKPELATQSGEVDSRLFAALTGGTIGGLTGAALTPDNRASGAAFGLALGVGGGALLGRAKVRGRKPPPELPPHQRRVQDRIGDLEGGRRQSVWENVQDSYAAIVRSTSLLEQAERQITGTAPGTALAAGTARVPSEQSAAAAARLAQGSGRRSEGMLEFGPTRWKGTELKKTGTPSYAEIQARVGVDELNRYEVSKRTLEVAEREIETGISAADATQVVKEATPALKKAHRQKVAYRNDIKDYWKDAGGVSDKADEAMTALGQDYVPLYRIFEGKDPRLGPRPGRVGRVGQQIKRLVGSERKILNPVLSDIDRTHRMVRAADLQRVGLRLIELAEAFPEGAAGIIEKAGKKRRPGFSTEADRLRASAQARGIEMSEETAAELAESLSDKALGIRDNMITVFRNGKLEQWRVNDRLAKGLLMMSPTQLGMFTRVMGAPVRTFKGGITLNPGFQISNFVRDAVDAAVQSQYGFRLGIDSFKGFYESTKAVWLGTPSKAYEEFVLSGGGFASFRGQRIRGLEAQARRMTKAERGRVRQFLRDPLIHPIEALKNLAQPFEEAARIGEFMRAREKGANIIDAFMAQQDVTINFLEHGGSTTMQGLLHMVPFLNPAIQSLDRAVRILGRPITRGKAAGPKAAAAEAGRLFAMTQASIALPSILFWAASHDDQEIKDRRKSNAGLIYWFIRMPDDKIVRIPKPFLWGQIFGTGWESALDKAFDDDPEAMGRFVRGVREQATAQIIPLLPRIWIEQLANRDLFFKTPIVPRGVEGLSPQFQTQPFTGSTTRLVAEWAAKVSKRLEVSPARLENIWGNITGTLGREGLRTMDRMIDNFAGREASPAAPEASDLPIVGRFFARRATTAVQPIRTFYDKLRKLETVSRDINNLEDLRRTTELVTYSRSHIEEIALLPLYRSTNKQLRLRRDQLEQLRLIPDAQFSRQSKLEFKKAIQDQMIEIARRTNEIAQGVSLRRQAVGTR